MRQLKLLQYMEYVPLRFRMNFPSIMGTDGKKYGPFPAGSVHVLPKKNAEVFIRRGVADLWL